MAGSSSPGSASAAAACPRTSGPSCTAPRSSASGRSVAFLREVDAINKRRRARTVDLVREQAGGDLWRVQGCCLGAAFKPNSDDIRDAPALDVARMLQEEGAIVSVYDPEAMDNARRAYPDLATPRA